MPSRFRFPIWPAAWRRSAVSGTSLGWGISIVGILIVATLVRFPALQRVPLPLSDEILAVVDVHYLIKTGLHFDGSHAGILAYVTPALDGRFVVSFLGGNSIQDFRLIAAFFGVLTVALMVWLGRELGDIRIGILSAAALAIMPWHIYYSRIFVPSSEYLFLTVLAICLELVSLRKRSIVLGMSSALAAAGSIYVYPVAVATTPLLMAAVLAYRWPEVLGSGGLRVVAMAATVGAVAMLPYALDHLIVTDQAVGNANSVITAKLIWNHGLDIPAMARLFLSNWLSYFTPRFLLIRGDPNVTQSIQRMGELGWVLGIMGYVGIAVGVFRQRRADFLLLGFTALYPIADALTYYDALGNSLRGVTGSAIWSIWVAVGVLQIAVFGRSYAPLVILAASISVALQSALFSGYYFGPYAAQYAYAFETGYDSIYPTLSQRGLQAVPITLHAGYERGAILEYFSKYRLRPAYTALACSYLPDSVLNDTSLPRIIIVREDRGFADTPGCVDQTNLIERDREALLNASPKSSAPPQKLDVLAIFANDPQSDYYTAIWYLHK